MTGGASRLGLFALVVAWGALLCHDVARAAPPPPPPPVFPPAPPVSSLVPTTTQRPSAQPSSVPAPFGSGSTVARHGSVDGSHRGTRGSGIGRWVMAAGALSGVAIVGALAVWRHRRYRS